MRTRTVLLLAALLLVGLSTVPVASAGPTECPVGDADLCNEWDHHMYCIRQKPPYLGDSWACFANPMPW